MNTSAPHRLIGTALPTVSMPTTSGDDMPLGELGGRNIVIFLYPRTGRPDAPDSGDWAVIPGARGCTAEACRFRDLKKDFAAAGFEIVGLSSQDTLCQCEAATRLHLPYPLLADQGLTLASHLNLETFTFEGATLYKRLTLITENGVIVDVVEPPVDSAGHPDLVLELVRSRTAF